MVCKTFSLTNSNYSLKISSLGAELKSVLFHGEEYLHQGDEYWHRSSPVLFPIVGKLKNNNYKYKNKKYTLGLHGFARYNEFELINQSNDKLTFLLQENENSLKHYPFNFNLQITYILNEHSLSIKYEVSSDKEILFSLGAHPAFLLKADINESYLKFEKKEEANLLCLDETYKCISEVKEKYLNSNTLTLNDKIFQNDALIFKNLKSNKVSLLNKKNKKSINITFNDFSHIGFWAPINAPFICIEPWCGIADHIDTNHIFKEKNSIISLKKDEVFSKCMVLSLT